MTLWITNIVQPASVDAVYKAKQDITKIATTLDFQKLNIFRYNVASDTDEMLHARIDGIIAAVKPHDIVVYQYPPYLGERFDQMFIEHLNAIDVSIILFVHDSERIRGGELNGFNEVAFFNKCSAAIVHNDAMKQLLHKEGVTIPLIENHLFDYLADTPPHSNNNSADFVKELVFAGTLNKSAFLTDWKYQTKLTAFGRNKSHNLDLNIVYGGEFQQDQLLEHLPYCFGLAWDTNLVGGGNYGKYTKYNNPHKISMYLSQGLPVIVWAQAGIAKLIVNNGLGYAIDSLDEIDQLLESISAADIQKLLKKVDQFSELLRYGYFTKCALLKAIQLVTFTKLTV